MDLHLSVGNWMICGDFDHIEFAEDSVGPTPLLHGSKRTAWNRLLDKFNLIDNHLIAVHKSGPHFTRQVKYGPKFDQSCLDRNYSSNRGAWFKFSKR